MTYARVHFVHPAQLYNAACGAAVRAASSSFNWSECGTLIFLKAVYNCFKVYNVKASVYTCPNSTATQEHMHVAGEIAHSN